jgi:cysteinyl-tRNA synthetase
MTANSTHETSLDPSTEISVPLTKPVLEFVLQKYINGSTIYQRNNMSEGNGRCYIPVDFVARYPASSGWTVRFIMG